MDNKLYGIIGVLLFVGATGTGGYIYYNNQKIDITPELLKVLYICPATQEVIGAQRLSSTGVTAYWVNDLNKTVSKTCKPKWVVLEQYYKDNNITIKDSVVIGKDVTVGTACKDVKNNSAGYFCYYTKDNYIFITHQAKLDCEKSKSKLECANLLVISHIPTTVTVQEIKYTVDEQFIKLLKTG